MTMPTEPIRAIMHGTMANLAFIEQQETTSAQRAVRSRTMTDGHYGDHVRDGIWEQKRSAHWPLAHVDYARRQRQSSDFSSIWENSQAQSVLLTCRD